MGGVAGSAGAGGASCAELTAKYTELVPQALSCPLGSTGETCNVWVDTHVDGCGYFKWGDASNAVALGELKKLRDDFKTSCPPATCPLGGFPPTLPAKCVDTGQGGTTGTCM